MKTLISNIKELVNVDESGRLLAKGNEMSKLQTIKDAYLIIDGDKIHSYGKMSDLKADWDEDDEKSVEIDATGKMVFPSFCDSHTHLVYAGSREIVVTVKKYQRRRTICSGNGTHQRNHFVWYWCR